MSSPQNPPPSPDGLRGILVPIADDLDAVEAILMDVLKTPTRQLRPLLEHVKQLKGKMLRPALTVLAGRCFGDVGAEHHRLGAVVELIHTATLVHDDVLDEAEVRRKIPTVNREWGNKTAVLLGDFLFSTAFSVSANLENRLASRYLSFVAGVVCQGEMLQILESGNLDLEEEVYLEVIEKKTAYLFAAAARVGADYAGATEAESRALGDYGMKMGTAFQIVDDCLDLDGEEERVGKTLGSDARQGKVTLPVIRFLCTAPEADRAKLRELLASGEGDAFRPEIRRMLTESGALEYARDRAQLYIEDAARDLRVVPDTDARQVLDRIAQSALSRRR